jgi:predicted SAM-dependent methyltransferase
LVETAKGLHTVNALKNTTRLDISAQFYRALHGDLHVLTDTQLIEHYHLFGEDEGRCAHPFCFTDLLLSSITPAEDVLEIGPYVNPTIRGARVRYFDVLDSAGLIARAAAIGFPDQVAPMIDYVSPTGDLAIVDENAFDVVFSCHCIEHVPDLIRHLDGVARILRAGGRYIIMIPDKRFCHDHYMNESTVADVIQAHHEHRVTHNLAAFIEGSAFATHNDPKRHWIGDHGIQKVFEEPNVIQTAIQNYIEADGRYTDMHAWRFTPRGFRDMITQLLSAKLTQLFPEVVLGTGRDLNTFVAVLKLVSP